MKNTRNLIHRTALATCLAASVLAHGGNAAPKPHIGASASHPFHLLKSISLPGAEGWDYLTMDGNARRLYVSRATHIAVVNVDSGKVVGVVPGLNGVHGVALNNKAGLGFTSDGKSNSVTVFRLATFKRVAEIPVGNGPDAIIYDPFTNRVFTFNGKGQSATAIDCSSLKVIGTFALPGTPEFAVADGRGHIFDNLEDKSAIAEIDSRTLKVEAVWPIAPGQGPSGIAIDKAKHLLFSTCRNRKLIVVDADNGAIKSVLAIGNGPDACAFDANTREVFAPNGRDGTLNIFCEISRGQCQSLGMVTTRPGARTIALDETTHRILTVTATPKLVAPSPGAAPVRRHRTYIAGTFVVLEYGR